MTFPTCYAPFWVSPPDKSDGGRSHLNSNLISCKGDIYYSPLWAHTALAKLAANPAVKRIEYGNLLATEERCLEWHAWYEDQEGELWQLDMIHIEKGSRYDGYFEEVARRISAALTDETREAILRLKWETPDTEKIAGIEYYMAVLRDGIRSYPDFVRWREAHPLTGVAEWMP